MVKNCRVFEAMHGAMQTERIVRNDDEQRRLMINKT